MNIPDRIMGDLVAWAGEQELTAVSVTLSRNAKGEWDFIALTGSDPTYRRTTTDELWASPNPPSPPEPGP